MQKVFVGLSGGVDSAVSAALLKRAGYDVTGVFIKIWQPEFIECTWREDRLDAMRVAATLQIPFREIDLSVEYERDVVRHMIAGYTAGITPNPDVLCNQSIKFGAFLEWARKEGSDLIATGHYARIEASGGTKHLFRGIDIQKDQSYFLYRLREADLAHCLFPVGSFTKTRIRALAARHGLPVAKKPDSQGLCFVGDVSMRDFLARFIPLQLGSVVDQSGSVIGEHDGAALYTTGQRHGFRILKGDASVPWYVVGIDTAKNTLTVSTRCTDAARSEVFVRDPHWISEIPTLPASLQAQARYRERPVSAEIDAAESGIRVSFPTPHLASPGQSIVLYDGEKCIGGGEMRA